MWYLRILRIDTQPFKSLGLGRLMFLKEVSYAYQGCIYLVKNAAILWNIVKHLKQLFSIGIYFKM